MELPKYKCHKVVEAAKIVTVGDASADGSISLLLDINDTVVVDAAWLGRNPSLAAGGYFVQYENGYTAFSPAGPFENGYTLLSEIPDVAADEDPVDFDLNILCMAEIIKADRNRLMACQAKARRVF